MLPNYLIVGAQKAGTTSLVRMLESHPEAFVTKPRETTFFVRESLWSQGIVAYERQFFAGWNGERAVGEKSPGYLHYPDVPGRIASMLGRDVKIVITLRSPAQRAFSHFRHNYQQFWEHLSFEEALAMEPSRIASGCRYDVGRYGYLDKGRYAGQVERYLNAFPRENVKVYLFESEIVENQERTARDLFRLLGIDENAALEEPVAAGRPVIPTVFIADGKTRVKVKKDGKKEKHVPPAGAVVIQRGTNEPEVIRSPSPKMLEFVQGVIANTPESTRLERADEVEMNRRWFREDIDRLSGLIERDLSFWL